MGFFSSLEPSHCFQGVSSMKLKLWVALIIVCFLVGIQFASMATRVNTEAKDGSGTALVREATASQSEQKSSPKAEKPATKNPAKKETQEKNGAPKIKHKAVKTSEAYSDIEIVASVRDDDSVPYVNLHFKKKGDKSYTSLAMQHAKSQHSTRYTTVIPSGAVESDLTYYIEATDGKNNSKTKKYKISVSKPKLNFNKVPPLLITEIVPDSTDVNGEDGYEFIEIYNNTNQTIHFKDYKIQYRNGKNRGTDVVWESVPDDFVIPSKGTVVFWIINDHNEDKTVDRF